MLSWVSELLANGSVPRRGGDTLVVRLELTVMMHMAIVAPIQKEIAFSPVIESDLTSHVCISDDTVDFFFAR